jgi:hypothetical protein
VIGARWLAGAVASVGFAASFLSAHAQTQNTDLTPLLTTPAAWDALNEGWARTLADGDRLFRTRREPARMFDRSVAPVTGYFEKGRLTSLSIVFLDSGAWFGFVPDDQAKAAAASRGTDFTREFREVSTDVAAQLMRIVPSRSEVTLGTTAWLKQKATVARSGHISARLTVIPDQLVKLSLFRDGEDAAQLLDGARRALTRTNQAQIFAATMRATPAGDHIINSVPVFPQGDRAYCGVSALACVMRFCGLTLDTEDFAAAAGIRFGSTRKSHIREVYEAAGKEAALHMSHSTKFEFARAQQTIDAGFPIVVVRRWTQERDFLHTAFARRFANDPAVELPRPDANDQKSWPTREGYAHASVINGYNAKRREVIFTESWSEASRDRRMRAEEMEATAYLAYYPHL